VPTQRLPVLLGQLIEAAQETQQEKDYWQLWKETKQVLSEAGVTVISQAKKASLRDNLVHHSSLEPIEYEEAMEKMYRAAAEIIERDYELLTRLWLAALAAAASIDPDDDSPGARYRSRRGNYYWYYRMLSGMVEETLEARKIAEMEQLLAKDLEADDVDDILF
jgi:hypothetical protein